MTADSNGLLLAVDGSLKPRGQTAATALFDQRHIGVVVGTVRWVVTILPGQYLTSTTALSRTVIVWMERSGTRGWIGGSLLSCVNTSFGLYYYSLFMESDHIALDSVAARFV